MFSPWRRTLACSPRSIPPSRTSWRRSNQKNTGVLFRSPEFFARVRTFAYGSQQVNVLPLAKNSGLQSTINPTIANELATINKALTSGQLSAYTDPNMQALNWLQPNPTTFYYPAGSLDYHATDKLRLPLAYNETMQRQPDSGSPLFPGSDFARS